MTSHEFIRRIETLLNSLEHLAFLVDTLKQLANRLNLLIDALNNLADAQGNDKIITTHAPIRASILENTKEIRSLSSRQVFLELERLHEALATFEGVLGASNRSAISLLDEAINTFAGAYEQFVRGYGPSETIAMLQAASSLHMLISLTRDILVLAKGNLQAEVADGSPDLRAISVTFEIGNDFQLLVKKLRALESLYSETCLLLSVSTQEFPLQTSKVESGTLFARLVGNSRVMQFIDDMLRAGISYLHRNYTREGKIAAIPRKVDALKSLLDLSGHLKESGIKADELNERIAKSAAVIGRDLNILLQDQVKIQIDDEEYSLSAAFERLFIEERKLLLENQSQDSTADEESDG